MILPDVLKPGLDIVFCGTAVSSKSALREAYYAGPGNKFYGILHKIGLTPFRLQPSEYQSLLQFNIGLTDLVKGKSGNDVVLSNSDFDIESFTKKISHFRPRVVCFNGKAAASSFLYYSHKRTRDIVYGLLNNIDGDIRYYVAPSTSGSANGVWDESFWFDLVKMLD